jgi:hypothetical protein
MLFKIFVGLGKEKKKKKKNFGIIFFPRTYQKFHYNGKLKYFFKKLAEIEYLKRFYKNMELI